MTNNSAFFAAPTPRKFQLLLLVAGLLSIKTTLALEVKDSDFELANPVVRVIYWADEKHVVASIFEKEPWTAPDGTTKGVESIVVWNVETNEKKRYAGPGTGGLCVGDGFVRYFQRRLAEGAYDELDRYYGPLGQEKRVVLSGAIDRETCRLVSELSPAPAWLDAAKKSGRLFKALKAEHGWVEMVIRPRGGIRANPAYPARIYRPGANLDDGIPIADVFREHLNDGYYLDPPKYVAIKNAYLVRLGYFQSPLPPQTGPLPAWWLYPDGKVEKVEYKNPDNWFWGVPVFSRAGILLIRHSSDSRRREENGLYADEINGPVRLVSGHILDVPAVSPDGCKVAYGNDPRGFWVEGPYKYRLQIIDLCERKMK